MTSHDLTLISGELKRDGSASGCRHNVSLLTALNRDRWAEEHARLLADPTSAASPTISRDLP